MKRILVTGAGGAGAINMCRSLMMAPEPLYLVGCDAGPHFLHLAETHERHLVPRADRRDEYLAALSKLVVARRIDLILPNNSIEALVLSENRRALPAPVFLPRPRTLAIANNKWDSYLLWRSAGLPVPRTFLIEAPDDIVAVFREVESRPVWVRGAGIPGKGIGVASLPCRTPEQAEAWVDYWGGWGGMIASEFLPGDNLTWIGLWRGGELITSQGRQRDAYIIPHVSPSGVTGAPAISHTVRRDDLNRLGVEASTVLDPELDGVAFLDFKCDAEGRPKLTEINAGRFGTTHHFYTVAGLNLPWLLTRMALGQPLPEGGAQYNPLPEGLYWVRTLDSSPALVSAEELGAPRRRPAPPSED